MLILPTKKKWFDMILSGKKLEEYRDIKPYYTTRFKNIGLLTEDGHITFNQVEVMFRNGYSCNSPSFIAVCTLRIMRGKEKWGAKPGVKYYVLKIIKIKEN